MAGKKGKLAENEEKSKKTKKVVARKSKEVDKVKSPGKPKTLKKSELEDLVKELENNIEIEKGKNVIVEEELIELKDQLKLKDSELEEKSVEVADLKEKVKKLEEELEKGKQV